MRELNLDTQRQNFWTEAIVKEKTVRLDWLTKHDRDTYTDLKNQVLSEFPTDTNTNCAPKKSTGATVGRRRANIPTDSKNFLQEISCIGSSIEGVSSEAIGVGSATAGQNFGEERFARENKLDNRKLNLTVTIPTHDDRVRDILEGEAPIKEPTPEQGLSEMRAVDPATRKLLYEGFSKEGKGRYEYLQTRTITKKPEEKYDYPHISQWEYGWRQDEQVELRPPKHGRSRVVRDTFYRTRGVLNTNNMK